MIIIDEAGDLTVEVVQKYDNLLSNDGDNITIKTAQFRVRKEVLTKASQTLLRMLLNPNFRESAQSVVSLGEGHVSSTEIWLRVIHKAPVITSVALSEMWHLTAAIDYYELNVTDFDAWFAAWYQRCNPKMLQPKNLLFPTWRFNHAKAFAEWTKYMAYHGVGHVTEMNPTKLYTYHLPSRIIQQLNAAKGRLRTVLHRGLFEPCELLFSANCDCRKETLFDYQKHLFDIGVWPLETVFQKTCMSEILTNLDKFIYEAKSSACGTCRRDYKGMVKRINTRVREYFDGLCLDCLNRSKPKLGDADKDYWRHADLKEHEWRTLGKTRMSRHVYDSDDEERIDH
ncbi:hypothetical protein P7C71_g4984, partial [Lecanoromycetidae sp. Uapishka_2]